jgi:hypothetical protein
VMNRLGQGGWLGCEVAPQYFQKKLIL